MNPDMLNILLNLASSALYSLLCLGGKKVSEFASGKELQGRWEQEKASVDSLLHQAVHSLTKHFAWPYSRGEEVTLLFLHTHEVEELLRQFYSTRMNEITDITSLRIIFSALFSKFLDFYTSEAIPELDEQKAIADTLFDALIQTSNLTLTVATNQGLLSAHEALSTYRHHIIQGELASIQKRLDFFVSRQSLDVSAILEYEKQYRKQVAERHGTITPPDFNAAHEIPIDDLYIFPTLKPVLEQIDEKRREDIQSVGFTDFLSSIQRTVVLGNPGGGKSTLAQKICHHLANSTVEHQGIIDRKSLTPILVVLRKYGVAKRERRCSIREYIETEFEATYQLPAPPPYALEYLLLNGHILVLFDGLDELLDTSSRQEIRDDVQSFCYLYPSTPVLVTSREVGYEQAPLQRRVFQVFRLEPLDDAQVSAYVEKWFTVASIYPSLEERQQKVQDFLKESQTVSDLRSNALMLALMCNIYRGENYIPRNRPEVYQKCADMLFERWDKSRSITMLLPFEAHIRPTMMYLAHWIYTNVALRAGVTERLLVQKATDYLYQKRFTDRDEAEQAARVFISFCRGRAWVFTDTGTEKNGERLYQFTHQTFLEYFTAAFLVRTHPTPDSLLACLREHIEEREWDVVAQLAIHIQHRQSEDAGDQILSSLLIHAQNVENMKQWNILDFTVRCLQFIVPSPYVVEKITEKLVLKLIQWGSEMKGQGKSSFYPDQEPQSSVYETFDNLSTAAIENHIQIAQTIEQSIITKARYGENTEKISAFALNDYLRGPWSKIKQHINKTYAELKRDLYPQSPLLCHDAVLSKEISLEDFLLWHGFRHIFQIHTYYMFSNYGKGALIGTILNDVIFDSPRGDHNYFQEACSIIKSIGDLLPDIPAYIHRGSILHFLYTGDGIRKPLKVRDRFRELEPDVVFGMFVLIAISFEKLIPTSISIDSLREVKSDFYDFFCYVIVARHMNVGHELVQKHVEQLRLSQEQKAIVWKWINHEVNFRR